MGYKLICTDMDGTLLDDDFSISKENIEAIKNAIKNGVKFALVTGRPYNVAKYFKDFLGNDVYIIGTNGTYFEADNNVYKKELTKLQLEKIYNVTQEYNLETHFKGNQILISNGNITDNHPYKKINKKLQKKDRINIVENVNLNILLQKEQGNVLKAIAFSDDLESVISAKAKLKEDESLEVVSSNRRNFEVMPKGTSKGSAVAKLANYLNISREYVICIGDNENDLSMINYAGLGIAVENATNEVKGEANYITTSNNDSAVAEVIKRFILNK